MEKLLSCPFCGRHPTLEDHRLVWSVKCSCGASVFGERAPEPDDDAAPPEYWARFERTAIDRWNARCTRTAESTAVPDALTKERIFEIAEDLMIPGSASHVIDFARAIERAHGIIPKE